MLPHRLRCLGTPQLSGPDGEPVRFRTRKHLALLVYLATVSPAPQRRDKLATMLWPRADLDEARHSLATALSVLRGRLGADAFEGTRDTVRLLPGRVDTDVAALLSGDPLERDIIGSAGFLEEFEVPEAVEFSHWVDRERARLLPLIHAQLARRITRCRRTGDSRTMERLAEQLWRVDPLSEEAARAMLEARAMAGDRISGLRAFDTWKRELAEQLGAVPSLEVERIADRLRRHALERHTTTVIAPVPAEQWRERPFVGRAIEFEACYRNWQEVRTGVPRHVILLGDAGVGKSTIAGRVVTTLALEGASVARLQCHELERELPFGVAGSLVEQLIELPGAAATPPEQLAELARLVAKVRQRWPGLPAPSNATGESARIQFTEAVMALIAALAAEQPVVIVIDDLHLSDAASLAVLHLALRRIESEPVMALLTMTGAPSDLAPEAGRFALRPEGIRATVHTVGPLPEAHAAELLELLLAGSADPGPSVRRALLAGAQGNPMVLELLLDDWRRRGEDSLALATGAMTRPGAAAPADACRSLVAAMLGALDQETRAVADLGAVLGRRLNDLGMYSLVNLSVSRTMRALTALTSARVLRDAGSHLEFANAVVRGGCYQAMAAPLRRMMHAMVADRLIGDEDEGEPISGLEIAWHLVRSDRLPEAVPYLLAGGREAIRRGAPHEADLALSTGVPALTGPARRAALLLLAEALQELGRWEESLRVLDTEVEAYDEDEIALREVLLIIARRWATIQAHEELLQASNRLLELALGSRSPDVQCRALAALPYLLSLTRDDGGLMRMGETIATLIPDEFEPYQLLHLHLASAWQQERVGNLSGAESSLTKALSIIDAEGFASTVSVRVLVGAGILNSVQGRYAEAVPYLNRAANLAQRLDNPLHQATVAVGLATAYGRLGDTVEQTTWASKALSLISPTDWSLIALTASYEQALARALDCDEAAVRHAVSGLDQRCKAAGAAWALQAGLLMKADALILIGDEKRAFAAARKGLALSASRPLLGDLSGIFSRWRALVAVRSGGVAEVATDLRASISETSGLHKKDRAESLAALGILEAAAAIDNTNTQVALRSALDALPPGVERVLKRVGLMPSL